MTEPDIDLASYAYAAFPTTGKGGIGVGGAQATAAAIIAGASASAATHRNICLCSNPPEHQPEQVAVKPLQKQ